MRRLVHRAFASSCARQRCIDERRTYGVCPNALQSRFDDCRPLRSLAEGPARTESLSSARSSPPVFAPFPFASPCREESPRHWTEGRHRTIKTHPRSAFVGEGTGASHTNDGVSLGSSRRGFFGFPLPATGPTAVDPNNVSAEGGISRRTRPARRCQLPIEPSRVKNCSNPHKG